MFNLSFLKKNSKKTIIFLLLLVAFLGLIMLLSLFFFSKEKKLKQGVQKDNTNLGVNEKHISISEFYLEDSYSPLLESRHYPLRPQHERWSDEQVKKYYIPVDKIITEIFEEYNDNNIKKLFKNIE